MINGIVKKIIDEIKAKIYTTGVEPLEGNWDTIENQNKLLYDKLMNLNPFIEYSRKVEYHTAYEYYQYPSRGWPVNIVNFYNKPYVVLKDSTRSQGGGTPTFLWSPLGRDITSIDLVRIRLSKKGYKFIGTYYSDTFKVVFINIKPTDNPTTIEVSYNSDGALIGEETLEGNTFNGLSVVRTPASGFFPDLSDVISVRDYILVDNLCVSFDNYFEGNEVKSSFTTDYIGVGGVGLSSSRIIFLQNPLFMGETPILGNVFINNEIWGYTKCGVMRFKC